MPVRKKWQIIATSTDNDKALVHIDETPSLIGRPVIYVRIARQLEGAEPLKSEFKQKLNWNVPADIVRTRNVSPPSTVAKQFPKFHEFSFPLCVAMAKKKKLRARQSERVVTSAGLMNKKETWHVRSKGSTRLMEKNHLLRLHKHAPQKTRIHWHCCPFFHPNICGSKRCNSRINTKNRHIKRFFE